MSIEDNSHAEMLAQSVGDFVQRGADLPRVRALAQTRAEFDRAQWRQLAELGWLGVLAPESCGGLGLGLAEATIVAEGLGRALTPEPYTAVAVLAERVLEHASATPLRDKLLTDLVSGDCVPVLAWQEQADDFAGQQVATSATPFEGGYRVSGQKKFVIGAAAADGYLVTAQASDGAQLLWVPRDAAGCSTSLLPLADGRSYGEVTLKDVTVPREQVLASDSAVRGALDRALDHAAAVASAELVGVMKRANEMSLDYMKTRVQFGKAIGSFQALQHRAVDLFIETELAKSTSILAAIKATAPAGERAYEISKAKAQLTQSGHFVVRQGTQLHGGIGVTDEHDIGLYFKRMQVLGALFGDEDFHLHRFSSMPQFLAT